MRQDKFKAYKLRVQGKSYSEINKLLGIPRATLSAWFSDVELNDKAKERISKRVYQKSIAGLMKRNKMQSHLAVEKARQTRRVAHDQVGKLSHKDLFFIGVSLYWAEGYKRPKMLNGKVKTSHAVSLTNSDPSLVRVFVKFLREVCEVPNDKITANLRIYEHQNEAYLLDFWSKITNIPYDKFQTFYYSASKSGLEKKPLNILPYGTIQMRVNNTALYHRIMGWIDGVGNMA